MVGGGSFLSITVTSKRLPAMGSGTSTPGGGAVDVAVLTASSREIAEDPLYAESLDKIAGAFEEFDTTGNGYLTKAEFTTLCQKYLSAATSTGQGSGSTRFSEAEIDAWFNSLDLNRDSHIDKEEFLVLLD